MTAGDTGPIRGIMYWGNRKHTLAERQLGGGGGDTALIFVQF